MARRTGPRIAVPGGGFGGLESAFSLRRRLGDRADVTLVSDRDRVLFKPNTIYIPFGLDPERLTIPLARPPARKGITFLPGRAREIDPQTHTVALAGGDGLGPEEQLPDGGDLSLPADEVRHGHRAQARA
jgi:sulfide:quinone oxidoreductase